MEEGWPQPKSIQPTTKSAQGTTSTRQKLESLLVELKLELEKSPDDASIKLKLSKTLLKLGRFQAALTYLADTSGEVQSGPKLYLRAFTLRKLKRYREAITTYELFLSSAKASDRASGVLGLAKTLELVGDPQGAIEQYQLYLDLEKRPSKRKTLDEVRAKLTRLKASDVVLIDGKDQEDEDEAAEKEPRVPTQSEVKKPKAPSSTSQTTSRPQQSISVALQQADQFFADKKYQQAAEAYEQLSQREVPRPLKLQLTYFAAVCSYLDLDFERAQRLAEQGLSTEVTDQESAKRQDQFTAIAVLSFIRAREDQSSRHDLKSTLRQVRLALKEGRFHDCLSLIEIYGAHQEQKDSEKSVSAEPLLLHAQGRALLGLGRHLEAYQALTQAERGFTHPHLTLDLALTAQKLGRTKAVRIHLAKLKQQTKPTGRISSPLHQLTQLGLTD